MSEEEKAHQFLIGINNEVYSIMCSQILALKPLPSLYKILYMISKEEVHKNVMIGRMIGMEILLSLS